MFDFESIEQQLDNKLVEIIYDAIKHNNDGVILKNIEEYFSRDSEGIVNAGIEIQKYLTRSAKGIDSIYFQKLSNELNRLGYFYTDNLIGGKCGDN